MKYEKIRGTSVSDCMMKLRSRFGSDVIILSTREVSEGGLFGTGLFARKSYEIDCMLEESGNRRNKSKNSHADLAARAKPMKFPSLGNSVPMPEQNSIKQPATSLTLSDPANHGKDDSTEELLALLQNVESNSKQASPSPASGSHSSDTRAVQSSVSHSRSQSEIEPDTRAESFPNDAPLTQFDDREFRKVRSRLLGSRLSRDFIEHFLNNLDHSLSRQERQEIRRVEEKSVEQLSQMIRTTPDIAPARGECKAIMLVGPTGSGKTTSLAKLAARYHIFQKRAVSLYSLDHYRLAAAEQLRTYAEVMDLPFHSPLKPEEFKEQIRRDGAEIILIDTSGIGHKDLPRLAELKRFVEACEIPLEKHLTLAANINPDLIEKILLAYDTLGFDKIILTKIDETDFIGAFIEHADKFNRPFSFLTNGQEVPGDLMEPQAIEMARLVLGSELPSL